MKKICFVVAAFLFINNSLAQNSNNEQENMIMSCVDYLKKKHIINEMDFTFKDTIYISIIDTMKTKHEYYFIYETLIASHQKTTFCHKKGWLQFDFTNFLKGQIYFEFLNIDTYKGYLQLAYEYHIKEIRYTQIGYPLLPVK